MNIDQTTYAISVIIPLYNSVDTIESAIDSVLLQTYSDPIEIIVVNDGSTDGGEEIVESYNQHKIGNRIVRLINKQNGGVSSARNFGILESKAPWIAFLDADDIWHLDKLDKQLDILALNPQILFLGANVNEECYPFIGMIKKDLFTLNAYHLVIKWYPSTPTVLVDKALLMKVGLFDEARRCGEDNDLWLRLLVFTPLFILNKSLVEIGHGKFSYGDSGLSANLFEMHREELKNLCDATQRGQINYCFSLLAFLWIKFKYYRRIFIASFYLNLKNNH